MLELMVLLSLQAACAEAEECGAAGAIAGGRGRLAHPFAV